jgi:hypothetical protein
MGRLSSRDGHADGDSGEIDFDKAMSSAVMANIELWNSVGDL